MSWTGNLIGIHFGRNLQLRWLSYTGKNIGRQCDRPDIRNKLRTLPSMCFAYQDHTHTSMGRGLYQDGGDAFKAEPPTQQNQDGLGRPGRQCERPDIRNKMKRCHRCVSHTKITLTIQSAINCTKMAALPSKPNFQHSKTKMVWVAR
jgi:hypothetical protein